MSLDRRLWRGKARWTHERSEGDDYILYNNQALFRYNAYTGFYLIHYLDLVEAEGPTPLSVPRLLAGGLRARLAAWGAAGDGAPALKPWARGFFAKLDVLKFAAVVGADGFPTLFPLVPCAPEGSGRLALHLGPALAEVAPEAEVAVLALSLQMETVLVRGHLSGRRRSGLAQLEIGWVYNPMLPVVGQIYPSPAELAPVELEATGGAEAPG